jgi:hypothetical protein
MASRSPKGNIVKVRAPLKAVAPTLSLAGAKPKLDWTCTESPTSWLIRLFNYPSGTLRESVTKDGALRTHTFTLDLIDPNQAQATIWAWTNGEPSQIVLSNILTGES